MGLILGAIGAITAAAVSVTKALAVVGLAVEGLKVIGNAIASIAKELGIIKPDRDIEEFGDRALQAEEKGITPDKYSSLKNGLKILRKMIGDMTLKEIRICLLKRKYLRVLKLQVR